MIKEIKNLITNKAFLFKFHKKTMFVKLFFNGKLITSTHRYRDFNFYFYLYIILGF